jgi:hypothetical protein
LETQLTGIQLNLLNEMNTTNDMKKAAVVQNDNHKEKIDDLERQNTFKQKTIDNKNVIKFY